MQMMWKLNWLNNFKRILIVIGSLLRFTTYHAFDKVNIIILKESETGPKQAINVRDYS